MTALNPIIGLLHNTKLNRWHPILFHESPLPGGPDANKPARHRSRGHHTEGFATREEAVAEIESSLRKNVRGIGDTEPKLCLERDFLWDGEDTPAMVVFFTETKAGLVPLM